MDLQAVDLLEEINRIKSDIPDCYLTLNAEITDANAAIFDAAHNSGGCIPGIHEILWRQGWCMNPKEKLSPGQMDEIDRIYRSYPHLNDDKFVEQHLDELLTGAATVD